MRGNGQKPSLFVIKTLYLRHVSVCITNCGTFSKTVLHLIESLGTVLYLYKVFVAKSKTLAFSLFSFKVTLSLNCILLENKTGRLLDFMQGFGWNACCLLYKAYY